MRAMRAVAQPLQAPSVRATMAAADWIALLALSLVWGASFYFYKVLVAELHPFTIVLGRVFIGALVLLPVLYLRGHALPRSLAVWRSLFVLAALQNVIPFALIAAGESEISSGLASIINATTPMFTVIVAHFATKDEKLSAHRVIGIVLGIIGVAVLVGPAALAGLHLQALGMLAALAAALTYGFAGSYGRRFGGTPPLVTATGTGIASTIIALPLVVLFDRPWLHAAPSGGTWFALLGIGVLSTAIAYLLYYRILAAAGATNAALVTLLVPISAVLLGVLLLGERLQWNMIAGMVLIFAGLAAIDGRLLRLRSAPR